MIEKFYNLTFFADKSNIHLVENYIEKICDHYNINNTYFAHILTSVTEAVENAIFHGNKNNPSLKVQINFSIKPEGYSFIIKDQGNGFNLASVPDATDPEADFSKTEGRGIFIMKSLADDVKFLNNGSAVELIFKLSSITKQLSDERIDILTKNTKQTAHTRNKHNKN
ncbi:MAG: ATP-binding protein [Bacteroidales bacterium]|nr:ATP-binding protein [Bacteroidales bacterium]